MKQIAAIKFQVIVVYFRQLAHEVVATKKEPMLRIFIAASVHCPDYSIIDTKLSIKEETQ